MNEPMKTNSNFHTKFFTKFHTIRLFLQNLIKIKYLRLRLKDFSYIGPHFFINEKTIEAD